MFAQVGAPDHEINRSLAGRSSRRSSTYLLQSRLVKHYLASLTIAVLSTSCRQPEPRATSARSPEVRVAAPSNDRPIRDSRAAARPPVARIDPPQPDSDVVVSTVGPNPTSAGRVTIVALHGLGDRPENFALWLRASPVSARVVAIRAPERYGDGSAWWQPRGEDAYVASTMDRAARHVREKLARATAGRSSCGQPMLVGFSQGAMVAFSIAGRREIPWRIIVPIAGRLVAGALDVAPFVRSDVEVRAMHGEADTRVPIGGGRLAVQQLRTRGLDATIRTFAGVDHSIPDEVRVAVFDELLRAARSMGCAAPQ
jgi:phospholipase/carboxylesterase